MKSIKPGRGPSMMGGIGSIFAALFGVFWTIMAVSMGAVFMAPFGLIFIGIAVVQAVYNFKNATSENRYSAFDITDEYEEADPLNERFGKRHEEISEPLEKNGMDIESQFCPYCGTKVGKGFEFCHKCGKKLP